MAERRILHYRILGRLGAGGMGEVLLAQDEHLGRRVALKFLPPGGMADPERAERLRREARSLASLNHPGIAAIHTLETAEDRPFLVMEYVEGETLADRIARRPLPIDEVIRVGRAVAEALAHAHARGVIHRDVKPANILVTPDGTTKLSDFGLALLENETRLSAEGGVSGTIHYMSPEQSLGGELDARTDIFSVGAVLYEELTGKRPFDAAHPDAVLHAIRSREPEPPTALRTGIPLELERIVLKCLRKDPALRYQSAADLAADLKALQSASDVGTVTAPAGAIARPRPRRKLRNIIAAAGVVASVLVVGGLLTYRPGGCAAPTHGRGGIAVLAFRNLADPDDPKREALIAASLLTVGLGQAQEVPMLGAQKINDVMRAMHVSEKSVSKAEALEVGRRAGATYVVTGYVAATSPEVVLAAEVASTRDGSLITASRVEAPGGDRGIFAAVDSLTAALRGGLAHAGVAVTDRAVDVAALTTRSPAAYRAFLRGMEELNQWRYGEARRAFESAIAVDSLFALPRYYAAIADWWENDLSAGLAEVARGLALGKRLSGRERDGFRGLEALLHDDYVKAEKIYRRLLERYPGDKEFLYGLGESLFHSNRHDEAARVLERVVAIDPAFGVAYLHLVDIDVSRHDLPGALAHTAAYARADPSNPAALRLEVSARRRLGDAEGTIAGWERLLRWDPGDRNLLYRLAVAYAWRGEFEKAGAYVSRLRSAAPEKDPWQGAVLADLTLLYARGRMRDVIRMVEARLAAAESATVTYRLNLGYFKYRSLEALHRYDEALEAAREVSGAVDSGYGSRGITVPYQVELLVKSGNLGAAEKLSLEHRHSLGPKLSPMEKSAMDYTAGVIALERGRAGEAIRLLERGYPRGPSRGWYHSWMLALAEFKAGNRKKAADLLRDIAWSGTLELLPEPVPRAWLLLARTLEQDGKRAEALALYRRVERQYREADPDLPDLLEARAGARRLSGAAGGPS